MLATPVIFIISYLLDLFDQVIDRLKSRSAVSLDDNPYIWQLENKERDGHAEQWQCQAHFWVSLGIAEEQLRYVIQNEGYQIYKGCIIRHNCARVAGGGSFRGNQFSNTLICQLTRQPDDVWYWQSYQYYATNECKKGSSIHCWGECSQGCHRFSHIRQSYSSIQSWSGKKGFLYHRSSRVPGKPTRMLDRLLNPQHGASIVKLTQPSSRVVIDTFTIIKRPAASE